uniref:Serine protease easter n=1 Tax=Cacopsylla melanoneura TaxID=428564 RepID=A0A8D8UET9_9HEMI
MRRVELFFVFLVEYCFIDGLSGLNWKQYDGFNPEEHENYKLLPPKNSCGTNGLGTQTESEKIVGGYETKLGEIPWIVQYGEYINGIFNFYCGASLISERYVLLAAHCINASLNPERFTVRLGEWNITGDPDSQGDLHAPPVQDIKIAEIIPHKDYHSLKNDIALIRLETTATLGFFVQPVCLPYGAAMSKDFTNQDALAAGWGSTKSRPGPFPTILLAVKQTVADAQKCKDAYSNVDVEVNYNDGKICFGGDEGKNVCFGDSGGPLLWKGSFEPDITVRTYLLGVAAHVGDLTCVKKGFPGVFTRTNFFMKWILDHMRA